MYFIVYRRVYLEENTAAVHFCECELYSKICIPVIVSKTNCMWTCILSATGAGGRQDDHNHYDNT